MYFPQGNNPRVVPVVPWPEGVTALANRCYPVKCPRLLAPGSCFWGAWKATSGQTVMLTASTEGETVVARVFEHSGLKGAAKMSTCTPDGFGLRGPLVCFLGIVCV